MMERAGLPFIEAMRASAKSPESATILAQLSQDGVPSRRHEDYRYSDLSRLRKIERAVLGQPEETSLWRETLSKIELKGAPRLVFVNGELQLDLCTIPKEGVTLAESLTMDSWFSRPTEDFVGRLAQATICPQVNLEWSHKEQEQTALQLLFLSSAKTDATVISSPAIHVRVKAGASLCLVQRHVVVDGGALTINRMKVVLEEGASCSYASLYGGRDNEYLFSHVHVEAAASAQWVSLSGSSGDGFSRQSLDVELLGPGAEAKVNGAYLIESSGHSEFHTRIFHRSPHTTSSQLYKGVLKDRSRAVFRGRVVIDPDAQKVQSSQLNKTLLLSDAAEIDALPQLEIHADDVKASHGATVGDLKFDEIFYLVSRGIPESTARRMLTDGFVKEANPFATSSMAVQVEAWMNKAGVG